MEGGESGYIPKIEDKNETTQILEERIRELGWNFTNIRMDIQMDPLNAEIVFIRNGVDLLLEKNKINSLINCLRIGVLSQDQESKVLDRVVEEESAPEVVSKLCEIVGRGNYGESLSPTVVDYITESKDLTSEKVVSDLSYVFGDRSESRYADIPEVPKWAMIRIWGKMTDKKSPEVSKFIANHILNGTLNKEYGEDGLAYVLDNLTLDSTIPLLEAMSPLLPKPTKANKEGIIEEKSKDINKRLSELSLEETTKMVNDWWKRDLSSNEIYNKIFYLVKDESVIKQLKKPYDISIDKKTKEMVGVVSEGNMTLKFRPSSMISPILYPVEDFLIKTITENNFMDDVKAKSYSSEVGKHDINGLKVLIGAYKEKMPDEAKDFFTTVLKLGLQERIKTESEKQNTPVRFLLKKMIRGK